MNVAARSAAKFFLLVIPTALRTAGMTKKNRRAGGLLPASMPSKSHMSMPGLSLESHRLGWFVNSPFPPFVCGVDAANASAHKNCISL